MDQDGSAGSAMLGLEGMRLLSVAQVDGEVELAVETLADEDGCRVCGVRAVAHGRRVVYVRDLAIGGRPTVLVWVKRLWRCAEPACPVRTWSETCEHIAPRSSWTERARYEACAEVGRKASSVARVARDLGVGWATVMRAVRDHGEALLADRASTATAPSAVGVDETAFNRATARTHTGYATGIVDLRPAAGGPARLLDIVPGRSKTVLLDWLTAQPAGWRDAVTTAVLDPFRGYAAALREGLPDAVRVLDAFHVTRLGFAAVDEVRRRVQQQTLARRGHRDDPLYGVRRLLLRAADHHSEVSWERMLTGLAVGDPDGEVGRAWIAAQDLRRIYRGAHDQADARRRLHKLLIHCAHSDVPELQRLARTLDSWATELLAYWPTGGISNGPTEAINLLIKKVKRVGHGFRNFANYRLRVLLHTGIDWTTVTWQAPPATPTRGRPHAS